MNALIALLPVRIRLWYADRIIVRLHKLDAEARTTAMLLDGVDPGFEYTESFRDHLARRLTAVTNEHERLARRLAAIDPLA